MGIPFPFLPFPDITIRKFSQDFTSLFQRPKAALVGYLVSKPPHEHLSVCRLLWDFPNLKVVELTIFFFYLFNLQSHTQLTSL